MKSNLEQVLAEEEKSKERRTENMNNGGDAAEIIVRLYLEGLEEVFKLSGKGIKELVPLLASTLKQESKPKARHDLRR